MAESVSQPRILAEVAFSGKKSFALLRMTIMALDEEFNGLGASPFIYGESYA